MCILTKGFILWIKSRPEYDYIYVCVVQLDPIRWILAQHTWWQSPWGIHSNKVTIDGGRSPKQIIFQQQIIAASPNCSAGSFVSLPISVQLDL